MRGTRAKRIRQAIYGDLSLRLRQYHKLNSGQVVREERRQLYQRTKKEWKEGRR